MRDAEGQRIPRTKVLQMKREQLARDPRFLAAEKLFRTPEGAELLGALGQFFDGDELQGETPEETAFNLGARWAYRSLRNMATFRERLEAKLAAEAAPTERTEGR